MFVGVHTDPALIQPRYYQGINLIVDLNLLFGTDVNADVIVNVHRDIHPLCI